MLNKILSLFSFCSKRKGVTLLEINDGPFFLPIQDIKQITHDTIIFRFLFFNIDSLFKNLIKFLDCK